MEGSEEKTDFPEDTIVVSPEVEEQVIKQWETVGICNDFVFCKVMQDKGLLAELIHLILPDLRFKDMDVHAQHTIEIGMDIHGVRFDIFVTLETGDVVEIEMQVLEQGNLPKRLRFYGSMADQQMLEKGVVYSKLKDSYVIVICPFDYYGKGRHVYTFTNQCHEEAGLEMADGTTKIVLNAVGTVDDVNGRLKEFLRYAAGEPSEDEYVKKLDDAVKMARANKEWRREYMTLMMRDLENQEIGIEKGRKEAHKEKIAEMLRRGKTPEAIAEFCGYPIELVKQVEESLLVVS